MNATFDKRLRSRPVRSRLGQVNSDLRSKLDSGFRSADARNLLRNRRKNRPNKPLDARNVIRSRARSFKNSQYLSPFVVPTKTVRNDLYNRKKPNNMGFRKRMTQTRVPQLFSLPIVDPDVLPLLRREVVSDGRFATPVITAGSEVDPLHSLSPIQGFRLEVKNLHPSVTVDDIYELFASVGTVRLCNILRPGNAEVVFSEAEAANEAIKRYHGRELDGLPMRLNLVTAIATDRNQSVLLSGRLGATASSNRKNNSFKNIPLKYQPRDVDSEVVHKALFNISAPSFNPRRPVDFNVSLH